MLYEQWSQEIQFFFKIVELLFCLLNIHAQSLQKVESQLLIKTCAKKDETVSEQFLYKIHEQF